jgi:hypothetical protein
MEHVRFEFFRVPCPFGFEKYYTPVAKLLDHVTGYQSRIVEVHWLVCTPFGSLRVTLRPVDM